jgi:hypothetical protein
MRRDFKTLLTAVSVFALVASVLGAGVAADAMPPRVREARHASAVLSAQRLIGNRVEDKFGQHIADVTDVIFDPNGEGVYAVLRVKGTADTPAKLVSVAYQRFTFAGPAVMILPITRSQLLAEPAFSYDLGPQQAVGGT